MLGLYDGAFVGKNDGAYVGIGVGDSIGEYDGASVGENDGETEGVAVGRESVHTSVVCLVSTPYGSVFHNGLCNLVESQSGSGAHPQLYSVRTGRVLSKDLVRLDTSETCTSVSWVESEG